MISRIYILFNIIFTCNSLSALPFIIKSKLLYTQSISYIHPITYTVFLMKIMNSEKNIPTDITNKILQYSISLKNENFIENFPYLNEWYDFRIPTQYQCVLTSDQLNTLSNIFVNKPHDIITYNVSRHNSNTIHTPFRQDLYYVLQSKEHYRLFLQLPIEVRTCLTKRPQTALDQYPSIKSQKINKHKKILVFNTKQTYFNEKPIVPKEKKQKNIQKFLQKK